MTFSCVQQEMQLAGASQDAIAFYHLTGWFLSDIEDMGGIQLASLFNPWRANENFQPALLGGTPAIVDLEQQTQLLHLEDAAQRDPAYAAIQAAYPRVLFWPEGPGLAGMDTSPSGGLRFLFDYRLLDGCHACALVGLAQVAFDFAPDGTYQGGQLVSVTPTAAVPQGQWTAVASKGVPNVRPVPSTNNNPIGNLAPGRLVQVTGRSTDGAWLQIIWDNNVTAWVAADLMTIVSGDPAQIPVVPNP